MNLLKSKLRRSTTVVGGAFLGLVSVAAFAAPALACETNITPISSCVNTDGSWVVEWQVKNSEWDIAGKISEVKVLPGTSTLTGISAGTFLPKEKDGVLKGTQTLPAEARSAYIALQGTWEWNGGGYVSWSDAKAYKPREKCKPQTSSPTPTPTTSSPTATPPTKPTTAPPTKPTTTPPATPTRTTTPSGGTNTPSPAKEPQFVYDNTCDTFTVGLEVPKGWKESITVTFKPSKGDAKTITVKPGETGTVDFPASAGLKVTASPKGYEDEAASITYKTPADCDTNGGGGGLPVTGAAAGGIAGGAAVLLALGAGLFFLARRRRVKFTA